MKKTTVGQRVGRKLKTLAIMQHVGREFNFQIF